MSKTYSSKLNGPQTQPIFGRTDMVKNNAGGYVFSVTQLQKLERFLLCGTVGGTYYAKESKLTLDNAKDIVEFIKIDGKKVLETTLTYVQQRRILKQDTAIFVLALLTTYGNEEVKKASYKAIKEVCVTSTHLFTFLSEIQNLRGWSNGLRKGVAEFYTSKSNDKIAYQMVKYRERNGFTHRDALRLSHPKATNPEMNNLFKYAVGKETTVESQTVNAYEAAKTLEGKALAKHVTENKLTWEMVPTEQLNDKEVLKALLDGMPLMALLRNLNRFAKADLTDGLSETTVKIVNKLTAATFVEKSGIHPIGVLNSLRTYSRGRGDKGTSTWSVNTTIVDALNKTFELSFKNLEDSGKRILVAVDVSGSMAAEAAGTRMTCKEVGAVMGSITLKSETLSELVWFDTQLYKTNFSKNNSFDFILKNTPNGGGTDCSLPLVYALERKNVYDAIIIYTDNETWAGKRNSLDVLKQYQKTVNKDVKVIEVAMQANPSSTLPEDKNVLRIVGYDANIPELINEFIKS